MAGDKKPKAKAKKKAVRKEEQTARKATSKRVGAGKKAAKKAATKVAAKKSAKVVVKKAGAKKAGAKDENGVRKPKFRAVVHLKDSAADANKETEENAGRDPFEIAKQRMKGSVPAIVDAMVELAKQGSCSHAKTLLEMTGARRMFDGEGEARDGGEPWAKLVLERLDEAESEEKTAGLGEGLPEARAER